MARVIVIGDIHGCHDEFRELLDRVGPNADDRMIAIGDLVDRGPASERVLAFFRDTPNALSITGNHERKHVRCARDGSEPGLSQRIVRGELGERYHRWVAFMGGFPRHVELPEAILVHAMLEPGLPLDEQKDSVVIGTMSGELHMRNYYAGPWYDHYRGPKPVVVGHHDYLRDHGRPLVREGLVYGIDTGCVYGGRLSALILPGFEIVSVPARSDHWSRIRAATGLGS